MMTSAPAPSEQSTQESLCAECGRPFKPTRKWSAFCSPTCRTLSNDRDRVQGRALVKLGKAMRLGRNTSDPELKRVAAWAMGEMCALLDDYIREDVKAGRPSALVYAAQVRAREYRPSLDRRGIK